MLEVDWHNGSDSEQVPELSCYFYRFWSGLKDKQLGFGGAKYAEKSTVPKISSWNEDISIPLTAII